MKTGYLVLVVGPPGAGKDTLIADAARHLAADSRFVFPPRLVTVTALSAAGDHDMISRADFDAMIRTGAHTLFWEAHGVGHIIPKSAARAVSAGRIAVCNASRKIVPEALGRYPGSHVIQIDAIPIIRATRLAARGEESAERIERRLAREAPRLPASVPVTVIDNSGALADGVAGFVAALDNLADETIWQRKSA